MIIINRSAPTRVIALRRVKKGERLKGLKVYKARMTEVEEASLNARPWTANFRISNNRLESSPMFACFC